MFNAHSRYVVPAKEIGLTAKTLEILRDPVRLAFAFLGSTHIQMPHDAWRTWEAAEYRFRG